MKNDKLDWLYSEREWHPQHRKDFAIIAAIFSCIVTLLPVILACIILYYVKN